MEHDSAAATYPSEDTIDDMELTDMKSQLTEFGLDEENLTKEEMSNLLIALQNSKTSVKEEEQSHQEVAENPSMIPSDKNMKRKYLDVKDRRMPWSILPSNISQAEKARTLAVYIKLMSLNNYHHARQSAIFTAWPPPLQIVEETTRVQPLRSTRSGRSVPMYAGFDEDSSDFDIVITKAKKRKMSNSDNNVANNIYSNKVVSLKRKSKEENIRPVKEIRVSADSEDFEIFALGNNLKPKKSLFTIMED